MKQLLLSLFILILSSSCGGNRQGATVAEGQGDTLTMKYAQLLTMVEHCNYWEVKIANPWRTTQALHTYWVAKSTNTLSVPQGVTRIKRPLDRVVTFSTVHAGLLCMLHAEQKIVGMTDLNYVKHPLLLNAVKKGQITDMGSGLQPNIERIIEANAQALFVSPFENSGGYGKIETIGVPLIECADYMEPTALGRAEWMKFYGLLMGEQQTADALFNEVEKAYLHLKNYARQTKSRPTVMVDKMVGSVWYVPGGKSTLGVMLADAQMRYIYADDEHSGSMALPFERVLTDAKDADIWLMRYASSPAAPYTLTTLLAEHHGYDRFKAWQQGTCYGCDTRMSRLFEETPFRPDFMLSDLIAIAHPESKRSSRYFFKIER